MRYYFNRNVLKRLYPIELFRRKQTLVHQMSIYTEKSPKRMVYPIFVWFEQKKKGGKKGKPTITIANKTQMTAWPNVNMDIEPITLESQGKEPKHIYNAYLGHKIMVLVYNIRMYNGWRIEIFMDEFTWISEFNLFSFRNVRIIENWMKTMEWHTHVSYGSYVKAGQWTILWIFIIFTSQQHLIQN